MQKVMTRHARPPTLGRFGWLMALYAENHERLVRMFDPARLAPGRYRSNVPGALPVLLDVIAQHPYTTQLRLSYAMLDPVTGEPDPSAHLRLYRDAGQVEATHCYVGRRWQDVIGMFPPPVEVVDHRLRMNTFLGKWLQYLEDQKHGLASLRANPEDARLDCSEAGATG